MSTRRMSRMAAKNASAVELEAIFIKEEVLSDNEEPTVKPLETEQKQAINKPFCALCLWECTSDVEVLSQPDIAENQKKLEEMLGSNVNLNDGVVCQTCWKLVDIIGDFRKSCINSASWIKQFSQGMQYEAKIDGWRSKCLLDSMDVLHKAIQKNIDHMEHEKFMLLNPPIPVMSTELEGETVNQLEPEQDAKQDLKPEQDAKQDLKPKIETESALEKISDKDKMSDENDSDHESVKNSEDNNPLILACAKCKREFDSYKGLHLHTRRCGAKVSCPKKTKRAKKGRKNPKYEEAPEVPSDGGITGENTLDCDDVKTESDTIALVGEDNHNPSIFSCEKCGRKLDGFIAHFMHVKRCVEGRKTANFTCSICNATFKNLSGLKYHMNRHNGIKPFKCRKFCNKTFYSNFVRIKHEDGICEVDGRVCSICGAQLKNAFSLRKHLEQVHGEAKYPCDKCKTTCRTREALKLHQRVHSEDRKYSCDICDKAYKSPYAVKIHMRVHTLAKPYACRLCDQAFRYNVTLKSHMERNHRQKA